MAAQADDKAGDKHVMVTSPPDTAQDVSYLIGAEPYAGLRHDASSARLSRLIDGMVSKAVPDSSTTIDHAVYLQAREQLADLTTLAAIAGDRRFDRFVGQWVELQRNYARQVIQWMNEGIGDLKNQLEICELEVNEGEAEREAYEKIRGQPIRQSWFGQLEERMQQLDRVAEEREQLIRTISGVSKVEQTLTTLIDSDTRSIHYIVPSHKEIKEQLGRGEYTGPAFEPFAVSKKADGRVQDMFMRAAAAPSIRRQELIELRVNGDLPPVLAELVMAYEYVIGQRPGAVINPGKFRQELGLEALGAKGIGSYLEDNQPLFGVSLREVPGSRTFLRQDSGRRVDKQKFLQHMLAGRLQGHDAREVNEFYFRKALALMRERPEAYTGFTRDDVVALAENQGFPLSGMYIARHLNNKAPEWGLRYVQEAEGQTPATVAFASVEPTTTQVELCREAVAQFGINRFVVGGRDDELVRKVHELHPDSFMSPIVTDAVMNAHHDTWGYQRVSNDPLQYQKGNKVEEAPAARSGERKIGRTGKGSLM